MRLITMVAIQGTNELTVSVNSGIASAGGGLHLHTLIMALRSLTIFSVDAKWIHSWYWMQPRDLPRLSRI